LIREVTAIESLLTEVRPAYRPRSIQNTWEWICRNGRTQEGLPFDGERIPWAKGVCDAWDDPATRDVILQWGTRTGKTAISMNILAKSADTKPMPGLFATSTQTLAKRIVINKIYPILHAIRLTRKQLPIRAMWSSEEIRLTTKWHVAWSGSDTQLADLSAYYGYANEIDKWSRNEKLGGAAGEGDPLAQFEERFKEFPDRKILFECSPSTKSHSRIEKKLLASNNCRYWVPCPQCGTRLVLQMGADNPHEGGILFDRNTDGSYDSTLAYETARYVCHHCRYEIHDDQRFSMMQAGVWAPQGCGVDKRGRVVGVPKRGPRACGLQLSSLYSLQMRWGHIAEEWVKKHANILEFRMFINGWLAETWEPFTRKSEPEDVGERLTGEIPRGIIPDWATYLFAAVDCQSEHFVYVVLAVGPNERCHLVDDGTNQSLDWIEQNVVRRQFHHADGRGPLCPALTLVDCGYLPKQTYDFCQRFKKTGHIVQPVKGSNTDCAGEAYEVKIIGMNEVGQNARTKKILQRSGKGLMRVRVNPYYYEPIIQEQLDDKKPGDAGSLTLHADARNDIDLLRQLCNGAESPYASKTDPSKHLWVKQWDSEPNDKRDALKYARCAADVRFKRNWRMVETRQGSVVRQAAPVAAEPEKSGQRRERFRPELGRRRGR
jgi:phage terminase large subunit GpA-like protein